MDNKNQNSEIKNDTELPRDARPKNKKDVGNSILGLVVGVFAKVIFLLLIIALFIIVYIFGLVKGYQLASSDAQASISQILSDYAKKLAEAKNEDLNPTIIPVPSVIKTQPTVKPKITWGGPDLWDAVNKRRVEFGVNPLNTRSDLCTIASIRLNELLELGDLDGHEGFTNMKERRPDLKKIFDNYSTVAEFLAMGGETPQITVNMWENTLGHSQLLKAGEYVWGCIYAQDSFAVAITAY